MLCYRGADLAAAFRIVRNNTIQVAEDIPEDKYDFAAAPGVQTVRDLLRHIALSYRFQHTFQSEKRTGFEGFDFAGLVGRMNAEGKLATTKGEIIALLKKEGDVCAKWLESLSDDFLCEKVVMGPGQAQATRTRLEMVMGIKEHEMHHRGQLMLIERILGIVPHLTRQREQAQAART